MLLVVALSPGQWKDIMGGVQSLITGLAVLAGAVWAYFRFIVERDHSERLTMTIELKFVELVDSPALTIRVIVRNVGKVLAVLERGCGGITVERLQGDELTSPAISVEGEVCWPQLPVQRIVGLVGPEPVSLEPSTDWCVNVLVLLPDAVPAAVRVAALGTTARGYDCAADIIAVPQQLPIGPPHPGGST